MRLQAQTLKEENALKELQQALKQKDPVSVFALYSDDTLIQLLHRQQRPRRVVLWCLVCVFVIYLLAMLGAFAHLWKLPSSPAYLFFSQVHMVQYLFRLKPELLEQVKPRLEQASVSTLLDAYALRIPQLEQVIREALAKRLAVVTTEELELLTPAQRKQLVRFTIFQAQLNIGTYSLGTPFVLPEAQAQAATVGFLALASLKQPGAHRISPQKIRTKNANLKRAIEEYQLMMKVSV